MHTTRATAARRYVTALRARLTPKAWLWLLAGFTAVTVCGIVFAELLDGVLEGDGVAGVDQPFTAYVAAHRTSTLTGLFRALTAVGDAASLSTLTAAVAAALAWHTRTWRPLWIAALTLAGSQTLVYTIKGLVGRPRPGTGFALATETGYSFPSGHATSGLAAFGVLAWLSTSRITHRPARVIVWAAAAGLAIGVGLSRIYLGVHYLSDVLAAWALGAGWVTVVTATISTSTQLRHRSLGRTSRPTTRLAGEHSPAEEDVGPGGQQPDLDQGDEQPVADAADESLTDPRPTQGGRGERGAVEHDPAGK